MAQENIKAEQERSKASGDSAAALEDQMSNLQAQLDALRKVGVLRARRREMRMYHEVTACQRALERALECRVEQLVTRLNANAWKLTQEARWSRPRRRQRARHKRVSRLKH
jgi:hypothetical protein